MKKKRRGFTLLEILISLGILGMVMLAISSFFLSNNRILNQVNADVDLQANGERIMNRFSEVAMASKNIAFVNGEIVKEDTEKIENKEIDSIVLEALLKSSSNKSEEYYCIFTYDKNKIYYEKIQISDLDSVILENEENLKNEINSRINTLKSGTKVLGNYVERLIISEVKDSEDITKGINIKVLLNNSANNEENEKVLENTVIFRN